MGKEENIERILKQIELLDTEEKKAVVERTNQLIEKKGEKKATRSLLELRGLGAEIWKDIDVEKYISDLRDEWERELR